ncbi:hypothetical protein ACGYKD_11520 [Sulfitobacter sp. TB366]|uniref:hypothetical protein n=1 Tax=Sulfitobacter sp. TB366 TaxID=3368580 RepID=UPI003746A21E
MNRSQRTAAGQLRAGVAYDLSKHPAIAERLIERKFGEKTTLAAVKKEAEEAAAKERAQLADQTDAAEGRAPLSVAGAEAKAAEEKAKAEAKAAEEKATEEAKAAKAAEDKKGAGK